jgi:branched-chain amino acid transport system permease protein
VPFALAILAATAIGATVGAAQEFFTLAPVRHRPHFIQITTTVGFAVVLRGITLIVAGKDALSLPGFSGDGVIVLFGAIVSVQSLWVWGATLLLLVWTFWFLRYTSTGRAVRACSINLQAARLMGVNAERLRVIVFGVSGATGALAGVVITPIVLASWDAGLTYSTKGFIGAILGGFRSPSIAVLGGLFIGVLESLSAGYVSSGWKDFIVYGALLAWLLIQGGVFLRGRAGVAAGGQ